MLDTLRLGSSLTVFYIHAREMWFPNLVLPPEAPGNMAHAAVVIFFVLSGYVIAHTTTSNNRGPKHYALARLSRLTSVVWPALLITAITEFILTQLAPAIAAAHSRGLALPRYLLAGSFLNEIWFISATPPINVPLWSLGFEFWYYTIFGLWFYRPASLKRLSLLLVACLIAGPKILLMMPLWLAGVIAYKLARPQLSSAISWLFVSLSLLIAYLLVLYISPFPFAIGQAPLFFAGQFLTDWIIGLFIALALWLLPTATIKYPQSLWIKKVRQVADLTFPLYVLHYPLLILWQGIFGLHLYEKWQLAQALIAVALTTAILGTIMEKQRSGWAIFFAQLINKTLPIKLRKHSISHKH
ncbi:acyltransferase [Hymenobacter sp. RP-2-7]|uniref:Acyltransferase n=1 Tax=Hymenobacter polaris TaxID=2682546 RepID=A0A7Y0AAK6_9BACT|nr:acyltransferase [Hymenobacter polaris]NML63647.1 acyltransferase [Hymenobacter polaris]